jgi:hypothetical protein
VCAAAVIVSVVVTVLEFGVTLAGLKPQPGKPFFARLPLMLTPNRLSAFLAQMLDMTKFGVEDIFDFPTIEH